MPRQQKRQKNMTEFTATDEQVEILRLFRESTKNVMVNALAGTGKTTTLEMIQAALPPPVLCLAFNKRAGEEMKKRFLSTSTVKTFNGLGHGIWYKAVGNCKLDPKKVGTILGEYIKELKGGERKEVSDLYWDVISGVGMAKALGYVPEGKYPNARRLIDREAFGRYLDDKPTEGLLAIIDYVLTRSIKTAYEGWIDFNDQVYMPALFGGAFPRYPNVLVDEGQDLNPVNHAMLNKLVKGRLGIVGDPWQSIYAFRGAVTSGMAVLKSKFSCEELDLSVSFRCPEEVVKAAHWRVPHLKWNKPGGRVEELETLDAKKIPDNATILCRNNAPLFRMALGLLMAQRAVTVSGSELGPKITRLLQKVCDSNDSQDTMLGKIETWRTERLVNSQSPRTVNDTADCMAIFAGFGQTLTQAVAYVNHIFEQKGQIKLMTGHKAKGGEWPIVYHLDPGLCREDDQDLNLRYVITTRAEEELYAINSQDINWR